MPFKTEWLIEGEIIYNRNWGIGTADEIRQTMQQSRALMDQTERPAVHMLIDNRDVTKSPKLTESAKVVREEPGHPRVGWLISVHTSSAFLRFFADVGVQLTGQRYRSFGTMEEALDFLRSVDDNISWDKLPEVFKV